MRVVSSSKKKVSVSVVDFMTTIDRRMYSWDLCLAAIVR